MLINYLPVDSDISRPYAVAVFDTGDVLRKWREQKGWSIEEAANRAKLNKNTINRAEQNKPTRTDTLTQLVATLGHSMRELHLALGGVGAPTSQADQELFELVGQLEADDRSLVVNTMRRLVQLTNRAAKAMAADIHGTGASEPITEAMTVFGQLDARGQVSALKVLRRYLATQAPGAAPADVAPAAGQSARRRRATPPGRRGSS